MHSVIVRALTISMGPVSCVSPGKPAVHAHRGTQQTGPFAFPSVRSRHGKRVMPLYRGAGRKTGPVNTPQASRPDSMAPDRTSCMDMVKDSHAATGAPLWHLGLCRQKNGKAGAAVTHRSPLAEPMKKGLL